MQWLWSLASCACLILVHAAVAVDGYRPPVFRRRAVLPLLVRPPFKTGTHTYASWKTPQGSGAGEYGDDDEVEEEEVDFGDDEDDGSGEMRVNGGGEGANNPVIEWLRKVYDAIFFYGLDSQIPEQRRRPAAGRYSSRSSRSRRRSQDVTAGGGGKKSLFFTAVEQLGQNLLNSPDEEEGEGEPLETTPRKKEVAPSVTNAAVIQRRIKVLDDCIKNSMGELESVTAELQRKDFMSSPASGANSKQNRLIKQQQNLRDAIEAMQVQFVALSVELEELELK